MGPENDPIAHAVRPDSTKNTPKRDGLRPDSPACRAELGEFRDAADREAREGVEFGALLLPQQGKEIYRARRELELKDVVKACGPDRAKEEDKHYQALRSQLEKDVKKGMAEELEPLLPPLPKPKLPRGSIA